MMDKSRACAKVQFSGASTKQNAEPVVRRTQNQNCHTLFI